MKYPQMIMFDYGHTLLCEPDWNLARGNEALLSRAAANRRGVTADDIAKCADMIFQNHTKRVRDIGYEMPEQVAERFLYEYLGLEFAISPIELEILFWSAASPGAVMPGADEMLDYLNEAGIRTAVISNIGWSGEALRERINRLLPNNRFEFVIASSDYMFRKPNRLLFELALGKAGLEAEDVWYCGDNPQKDIYGAAEAGIFPVWYDNDAEKDCDDRRDETAPTCAHLHIKEWREMIEVLKRYQA